MTAKAPGLVPRLLRGAWRLLWTGVDSRDTISGVPLSTIDSELGFVLGLTEGATTSGVRVTKKTALGVGAVLRGINLIATSCAKVPLDVKRRVDGGWDRDSEHPAFGLLRNEHSPGEASFVLRRTLTAHAIFEGNGYAYIHRTPTGDAFRLTVLEPTHVTPFRVNGLPAYHYTPSSGASEAIPGDRMLHIRGLGWDGLQGLSVFDLAKEALGEAIAARAYTARFFSGGAGKRVVLEAPNELSEGAVKRFVSDWRKMHGGVENAHRTAILEQGMTAKVIGTTPREAQLEELRDANIRQEIANFLGLTSSKLGDKSNTSYGSLEQENQDFLDESVDPWLVAWESEGRVKLLRPSEKASDSHTIEANRQALVWTDLAAETEAFSKATGGKPWMTPNEVRSRRGMLPIEGGDVLGPAPSESSGAQSGEPGAAPQAPPSDPPAAEDPPEDGGRAEDLRRAVRAALDDVLGRMRRRLCVRARKAAKHPETFGEWLEGFDEEHAPVARAALAPIVGCAAAADDVDPASLLREELEAHVSGFRSRVDHVYSTVPESRFAASLETVLAEMEAHE